MVLGTLWGQVKLAFRDSPQVYIVLVASFWLLAKPVPGVVHQYAKLFAQVSQSLNGCQRKKVISCKATNKSHETEKFQSTDEKLQFKGIAQKDTGRAGD